MSLRIILSATVLLAFAAGTTFAATVGLRLGPSSSATTRTFKGYYDGHKDTFLVTDVSNKAQASAMKINHSAEIGAVKGAPPQYFV